MKSKAVKGLLIFAVCFVVVFGFVLFPQLSKDFGKGYEQGFESEFIASCSEGELPEGACQCLYTQLRKKYSMAEMSKWSMTGFPDDAADEAALACNLESRP